MRAARVALALASTLLLSGTAAAAWGMPDALTERGRLIQDIYGQIFIAGLLVFILVMVLMGIILWRFRESTGKGRATHEKERHSTAAEVAWLVGPLILVTWIGIISYQGLVALDSEYRPEDAVGEIKVTGARFSWEFDYSGMPGGEGVRTIVIAKADAATGNVTFDETFHVPADVPITLNMTAADVIHAFQILDANNAAFSFNDVNPLGEHKWTQFTTSFPAGVYKVQCNKLCGNPGHAYMRAEIIAEPQAEYEQWLARRAQLVGAESSQEVKVTATATGFDGPRNLTIVTGTRLVVEAVNPLGEPVSFLMADQNVTVPARGTRYFHADFPTAGGANLVSTQGGRMDVRVIDAEPVAFTLADFTIAPASFEFKQGTTYLVKVKNDGASPHNLFIGSRGGAILASSPTAASGQTVSFTYTPTQTGTFETWCDVPGHYEQGMHEHATVA